MAEMEEEFKDSTTKINVSIQKSTFSDNETFFGRVSRNTVNIDNLIKSICNKIPSYDKYELKRFAKDLKTEVQASIASGKSVNLLDLGTLYIALSSGMKVAPKTASEVSSLTVKFSPSKTLTKSVNKIEIDKIVYVNSSPLISNLECLWEGLPENTVKLNKIVRITGSKLKVEGENGGVFFCEVDSSGNTEPDESKWVKAIITRNLPKTLELYVPANLETDKEYAIGIKTRPTTEGIYSVGFSNALNVVE